MIPDSLAPGIVIRAPDKTSARESGEEATLSPPAMSTECVSTFFAIWSCNSLVVSEGSVLTAQERHSVRL